MDTLNDLVEWFVKNQWRHADTELVLDPLIPKIYRDTPSSSIISGPYNKAVFDALDELFHEVSVHIKSTNRKVKTELQERLQIIELAWGGEQLSEDTLQLINGRYQDGSTMDSKPSYSGTSRAGYDLGQIGGEVLIENYSDGLYVVRNIVKIPTHV